MMFPSASRAFAAFALLAVQLMACGTSPDGTPSPDAAPAPDAAPPADATPPADITPTADAAAPPDAALSPDAAPPPDDPWGTPRIWAPEAPGECPQGLAPEDPLTTLMAALSLDPARVGIPRSVYAAYGGAIESDPARLGHFHALQEAPTTLPCFAGDLAAQTDAALAGTRPLATAIAHAATRLDLALTVGGELPNADAAPSPLLEALDVLHGQATWTGREAAAQAADGVPLEVQRAAARLMLAAQQAAAQRDAALEALLDSADVQAAFDGSTAGWLPSYDQVADPDDPRFTRLWASRTPDHATLYAGGVRVAQAIDEIDWLAVARAGEARFEFSAPTPLGQVVLGGADDTTYDPRRNTDLAGDVLLVLDTGGDDVYRVPAGATTSITNPVSLHVDLGGDDTYGYVEVPGRRDLPGLLPSDADGRYRGDDNYGPISLSKRPRQGAGLFGYGLLVDLGGGADQYRSPRMSQGFSSFGVGVLYDDGGDDAYEAENGAQGAALGGIALLIDRGGRDTYRAFQNAQGFGWVGAFGALHDGGGDDTYTMVVDEVIIYASPQTQGFANSSLGQGAGFGWRRDATGTHLSGGLALLRDVDGNDSYAGSTFVQGSGYWMGLGVLADGAGDDRYEGVFYAQAAAAHFALAALIEGGGEDVYNVDRVPTHSMLGLGHDFSVAALVERGGNDRYRGPDRSLGASKCHGLGLFADAAGDDAYEGLHNRSIGWATDYDWAPGSCGDYTQVASFGFFVDADGIDTYVKPDASAYGDGRMWLTDDPDDPDALERSGGIDVSGGVTLEPASAP